MNINKLMKILHTADWHLGQKYRQQIDRIEEHRWVFDWLKDIIAKEKVDILLVAGDIFDTTNPPNNARQLYYDFLMDAKEAGCRHIVITGGNHDSPSMLNAPNELTRRLGIHVVGCVTSDLADEVIELKNEADELEAVIAAVPFLRDRDLKSATPGESGEERIDKIKAGIRKHYADLAEYMIPYGKMDIPLITTGHLYARGATASASQNNIYIGDMENIAADDFPEIFDYVALGHLHKPQMVGKQRHIRYSGSLIPMSLGEWKDQKSVTLLEWEGKELKGISEITVPLYRRLVSLSGNEKEVEEQLHQIGKELLETEGERQAWIEINIQSEETQVNAFQFYRTLAREYPIRILRVSYDRQYRTLDDLTQAYEQLEDLAPAEVFLKRCESQGLSDKDKKKAEKSFQELLNWMQEKES